ncbi:secretin receptor isoform X2 [Phocoena sinus]|uniref:secretin receptor isoform X2 n=1 Tax=Phocoena sinus TaxID=42100 RepID=UPI0013C4FEEF|nr:secretin receptor isoform X2 [Phocoena sinus]
MRALLPPLLLLACAAHAVGALPRLCAVLQVLREERDQCLQGLAEEKARHPAPGTCTPGPTLGCCQGLWDNTSCWPSSALGQTVEVACPRFLWMLVGRNGSIFRNCTQGGWSETFPRPDLACGVHMNDSSNEKRPRGDGPEEHGTVRAATCHRDAGVKPKEQRLGLNAWDLVYEYLLKLKVMYTVGYSSSLVMLLVALGILCAFRKLHCTRNYIHMHLFVSFILRALSNFIKDAVLFSSDDVARCDAHRVGCKLVMVFFQYCIMANYSWLLVEGLYLHTLLVISFFSERKWLQGFIALGWGSPAIFVASWAVTRHFLEDVGCWDINANASIWWVIRGPVIVSVLINFILFINILRILMRKLRTQETRGSEGNHYKMPWRRSCSLNWPLAHSRAWWWPFSTASSMGRCSWRFRRSGGSGTCVSSHCTRWPSAPSAAAPRPVPRSRAGVPAGPVSSEAGAGPPRQAKMGPEV